MSTLPDHAAAVMDFLRRQRSAPDSSSIQSTGLTGIATGGGGGGGSGPLISGTFGVVGGAVDPIFAERAGDNVVEDYFANSVVEEFWSKGNGTWTEGASGIECNGTVAGTLPRGRLLVRDFGPVVNGRVECIPNVNLNSGVVWRWDDAAGTGYLARRSAAGTVALLKRDSYAVGSTLGSAAYVAGQTFGISANGTTIELLINGVVAVSVIDAGYASGDVGICTQADGSSLRWFRAEKL